MSLYSIAEQMKNGTITSVSLTEKCLLAISDNDFNGRKLNSVAELNPNALFEARYLDKELKEKGPRSPLHGIPVLVKDNIDVKGMRTTAGSFALNDLIATEDAEVIKKLKSAGAVILGKTNLSEFAYWMSTQGMPSGYSSRAGQVINAYVKGLDPCGSSSGSGVAAGARFTPFTIGTETSGSLTSPARANNVSTIKPTIGVVSRTGILPISNYQDTAGPMAPSIKDVALALNYIQGVDSEDPATLILEPKDYTAELDKGIQGMRIGVVNFTSMPFPEKEQKAFENLKVVLKKLGAEPVEIDIDISDILELECMKHEFKNGIEKYLAAHNSKMKHLSEIIEFNKNNAKKCLAHGQDILEDSDAFSGLFIEENYTKDRIRIVNRAHELLEGNLEKYDVECLISAQKNRLAPVSGNPVILIPAEDIDVNDPFPLGYYIIGKAFDEVRLFRVASALEDELALKKCPEWVKE